MKRLAICLAAAAVALTGTAASAETRAEKGEARLAKMLEGHVAGEPVSCIPALRTQSLQVIDRVGVVYDAGDTIYVARAERPESLDGFDTLVVERRGSTLCRHDMMRTVDLTMGHTTGLVFLSEFVPYTEADAG